MSNIDEKQHQYILQRIARRAMIEQGLIPDFSDAALDEFAKISRPAMQEDGHITDLRDLLCCSIDNDDSRDLDQLTVSESAAGGAVKILIAVADVDAVVKKHSAIDDHTKQNTTSVYTAAEIFPMLPVKLSADITSLNYGSDRLAVVIEAIVDSEGEIRGSDVNRAKVRNHAKLAYGDVASWLEGKGPVPMEVSRINGLSENIRLQDMTAQKLRSLRHRNGALNLETI